MLKHFASMAAGRQVLFNGGAKKRCRCAVGLGQGLGQTEERWQRQELMSFFNCTVILFSSYYILHIVHIVIYIHILCIVHIVILFYVVHLLSTLMVLVLRLFATL